MQPVPEPIPHCDEQSFTYRWFELPRFPFDWHVHDELELTWIVRGRGQRYVGDHVETFAPGDLVLLGSKLPHTWYSPRGGGRCVSVVIHFPTHFMSQALSQLPELVNMRRLLARSGGGLGFSGSAAQEVGRRMQAMAEMSPVERLTTFIQVMDRLARCRGVRSLASDAFASDVREYDRRRMGRLQQYIHQHYDQPITLADAAGVVKMNPTSFARFFRRVTGRSFIQYLQQLRIAHACRRLIDSDRPITDICYLTGFGNLSNFNRVFQRLKGTTPRNYRNRYVGVQQDDDAEIYRKTRSKQLVRCRVRQFGVRDKSALPNK